MKRVVFSVLLSFLMLFVSGCGSILDRIEDDLKEKKYKITFNYNDGSGMTETKEIDSGRLLQNFAPDLVCNGDMFMIGWSESANAKEAERVYSDKDKNVYAVWKKVAPTVYNESDMPETITDVYAKIEVESEDANALSGKKLIIGESCKKISFKGKTVYRNFSISAGKRYSGINIELKEFGYYSSDGVKTAFDFSECQKGYSVNLSIEGSCYIKGDNSVVSVKGINGISVGGNLNIAGDGELYVFAGNGNEGEAVAPTEQGKGGDAGNPGSDGGDGIICDNLRVEGIFLKVVAGYGGWGSDGGNGYNSKFGMTADQGKFRPGGNGGKGGNGGNAVTFSSGCIFKNAQLWLKGGNGGFGGSGGKGGGSTSNFAGKGGNGGYGGIGGDVFSSSRVTLTDCEIETMSVGIGGAGGAGGESLAALQSGSHGSKGSDGRYNYYQN